MQFNKKKLFFKLIMPVNGGQCVSKKKSSYATGPQLNSYVIISIMCDTTSTN